MQRATLALLLLVAFAASARASRGLRASAVCPDGCDLENDGCVRSSGGGFVCVKCYNNLIVNKENGLCACPKGKYSAQDQGKGTCNDCEIGYYCSGGDFTNAGLPERTSCTGRNVSTTTLGKRAITVLQCVNMPGYRYTYTDVDGGTATGTVCAADTFSPGLKKQPACTACAPGLSTWGAVGQTAGSDCKLKAGYFFSSPGIAAPCPKGEWNAGNNKDTKCTKCAAGVTTAQPASNSADNCTDLLPGYQALTVTSGKITVTQRCQQDRYCPGGNPTAIAADTSYAGTRNADGSVTCWDGTWTKTFGATSSNECLVPPGYEKAANGAITACANQFYRANWQFVASSAAISCDNCGAGFQSEATETVQRWNASNAVAAAERVLGSKGSCYMRRGEGSYPNGDGTFYVQACNASSYGVAAEKVYGVTTQACRDCPSGTETQEVAPSVSYRDNTTRGYFDPQACVTKSGYGYNGKVALKCAQGSWNAGGNTLPCTQCPYGTTTTPGNFPTSQNDATDCTIAPGFGYEQSVIKICPVGTYNSAIRPDLTTPCTVCPTGYTTTEEGANAAAACNTCQPGYGYTTNATTGCANQCTTGYYGPAGRDESTLDCAVCPQMTDGYSFEFNSTSNFYKPAAVSATGANNAAECLAAFAQIEDSAWELRGDANATAAAADLDACLTSCSNSAECMWATFDYNAGDCTTFNADGSTTVITAFRTAPSGDEVAAAGKRGDASAESLASGFYTFWKHGGAVGEEISSAASTSYTTCMRLCNLNPKCAAFQMTNPSGTGLSATGTCSLRMGDTTVDTGNRSLTKAVPSQLVPASAVGTA